jgi:hypothetical protein
MLIETGATNLEAYVDAAGCYSVGAGDYFNISTNDPNITGVFSHQFTGPITFN